MKRFVAYGDQNIEIRESGFSQCECYIYSYWHWFSSSTALRWRHNDHAGVSNHQPHGCLLNRLFRCRWKKTSKLRVTGLCAGNSPGPGNSPHKGPVTRKMFPFDDVIMRNRSVIISDKTENSARKYIAAIDKWGWPISTIHSGWNFSRMWKSAT